MKGSPRNYDYSFKILLAGDSGVGKSSLLLSFISDFVHDLSPTIGVDFKIKQLSVDGKRLKLTIWDTAGQERFGTVISSYYRGAHGIILVYDVTRRETFTNLSNLWAKEVDRYSTNQECIKILVGNKVDRDKERVVTREEGMALAQEHKCLFLECSAKTKENVQQCFKDLTLKMLEVPSLMESGSVDLKRQILKQKQLDQDLSKQLLSNTNLSLSHVPSNHRIPRRNSSRRQFIKHHTRIAHLTTFHIHVNQRSPNIHIRLQPSSQAEPMNTFPNTNIRQLSTTLEHKRVGEMITL